MERQMAIITRLLQEQDFGSLEEANAFLQEALASGDLPEFVPTTPLEQAQDLVYQALEATGKRRLALARKALTISPDCADAYVLLAESTRDLQRAQRLYEQGVQAGERALGTKVFDGAVGEFWGMNETRPYMRARHGLALVLWHLGEHEAAIGHARGLLRLNPGDNQGIRYLLAAWLLAVGDDAGLAALLAQYPDEWSANWAYTRALLTLRQSGAGQKADQALKQALEINPHVPGYLLGVVPFPKRPPEYYGMGDENEAVLYVAEGAEAWLAEPEALAWLTEAMLRLTLASRKPGRPRTGKPKPQGQPGPRERSRPPRKRT
jgi:tetratricopeptide (TPR) repeat protein